MSSPPSHLSFTLFADLPVELRQNIWAHAIDSCHPRILDLHRTLDVSVPNYPLPTLLQTTHESRRVALKTYLPWPKPKPAPALLEPGDTLTQSTIPRHNSDHCSYIYVSTTTDVCIVRLRNISWKDDDESIEQSKDEVYRQIRHIAMSRADWQRHLWQIYNRRDGRRVLGSEEQLFGRFMALETMHIFLCEEKGRALGGLSFTDLTKDLDIMLDYLESYSSFVVLMTGNKAFEEVKDKIEGWKVPVLRAVYLEHLAEKLPAQDEGQSALTSSL